MTIKEFNNLRVGDFIPVVQKDRKGYGIYQILYINRTQRTLQTILQPKPLSYKLQKTKRLVKGLPFLNTCGMYDFCDRVETLVPPLGRGIYG